MTRLTRRLVFAVTSVLGLLALPGTAFAMPAPIPPDTSVSDPTPVIIEKITSTASVALWQLALVAMTAAIVTAVAVSVLTRLTSTSRRTHPQPA
ncbi:MAG TPA: hypothetical protein VIM19_02820 [Actinomycetes bacterium]